VQLSGSAPKEVLANGKGKKESRKSKHIPPPSIETTFFGSSTAVRSPLVDVWRPAGLKSCTNFIQKSRSCSEGGVKLPAARRILHEVCSLLLGAYESLQYNFLDFSNLLPEHDRPKIILSDCAKRLEGISEVAAVRSDFAYFKCFCRKHEQKNRVLESANVDFLFKLTILCNQGALLVSVVDYYVNYQAPHNCMKASGQTLP
jgi:hypothetical protein